MDTSCKRSCGSLIRCGIFEENPIFRLAISLCPAIAVTQNVRSALLMGLAVLFVQVMVNLTVALFKNHIHTAIRLPIYMVIIAGYVTIITMLLEAFVPDVFGQVGLYFQLIVAFASILVGAETFASRNRIVPALFDGLGRGLGFCGALLLISLVRELAGYGSIAGFNVLHARPLLIAVLPAGGFLTVGMLMAFFNWISGRPGAAGN
jgi:electron transport complex protein RnfE